MNIEDVREYVLSLPNVAETEQFEGVVVYKVVGKWFAVVILDRADRVAVKCDPDRALVLRDRWEAITPAWHFNKRHWNDLRFGALPDEIVRREIAHSYLSVITLNVTPKAERLRCMSEAAQAGVTDAEAIL